MMEAFLPIHTTTGTFATDSFLAIGVELQNNPIAIRNEANNWGFILFFICFFIIVSVIGKRNKFVLSMFSELYRNKDRQNMFKETLTNETLNKYVLSFQTVILVSIVIYCYATHAYLLSMNSLAQMLLFVGKIVLLLVAFLVYKSLSYSIVGAIFFKKESVIQWNSDFFSLISLNGILLFLPTILLFYVEAAYTVCIYFMFFYLIFNLFFIFYKTYTLFFPGKQGLLYFILYLCSQEMIPLYLVYRGVVYLIAQKDTIWMLA